MKRVLTAAVAIPIVVLLTLFASDWIFAILVGAVSALAVDELFSLAAKGGLGRPGRWFLVPVAAVSLAFLGGFGWIAAVLVFGALALMSSAVFSGSLEGAFGRVAVGLGSLIYCPLMLGFLVLVPRQRILLLYAIIWAGDTAAYYGGRALGRHALAPKVSPKKTIEGGIAGLLGSVLAGIVGGSWLLGEPVQGMIWMSVVTAIAGQLGDLAESVLKRSVDAKDSSSILPGHGGILDRLDSLFFAAPVFYWFFIT